MVKPFSYKLVCFIMVGWFWTKDKNVGMWVTTTTKHTTYHCQPWGRKDMMTVMMMIMTAIVMTNMMTNMMTIMIKFYNDDTCRQRQRISSWGSPTLARFCHPHHHHNHHHHHHHHHHHNHHHHHHHHCVLIITMMMIIIGASEHASHHQGNLPHEPRQLPHGRPDVHGNHDWNNDDDDLGPWTIDLKYILDIPFLAFYAKKVYRRPWWDGP